MVHLNKTFKEGTIKVYKTLKQKYPNHLVIISLADSFRVCDEDLEVFKKWMCYLIDCETHYEGHKIGRVGVMWNDNFETLVNYAKMNVVIYDAEKKIVTTMEKLEI